MKKMSSDELSARINRFMDSKKAKVIDVTELSDKIGRRSQRRQIEVTTMPFIPLAIK